MDFRDFTTQERGPFFRLAASYVHPGMRVVDVGAGDGAFADLVASPEIWLVEGNPDSAERLRARYKNVISTKLPDRLPVEDGFFDLIHCSHVIEHLQPDDLVALLGELDRCLAANGFMIISTPLLWEHFYDDLSHVKPYTPRTLEAYLCGARQGMRTSRMISDRYETRRLQHRYRVAPMPYFSIGYNRPILQKILFGFTNLCRRMSLGTLEVNGYTLVLQKAPL